MTTTAGWYEDPESPAHWRWWNGSTWGPRVEKRPAPTGIPAPPPSVEEKPLARRMKASDKWAIRAIVIAAAFAFWATGILGGESEPDPAPSPAPAATSPAPTPPAPTPSPTPKPPATPDSEPAGPTEAPSVTLSAEGEGNSAPFELEGGDYLATVTIGSDCSYFLDLEPLVDEMRSLDIGSWTEAGESANYLYGVEGGTYYVEANTGPVPRCPWSVTLEAFG